MRASWLLLAALPLAAQPDRTLAVESVPDIVAFSADGTRIVTGGFDVRTTRNPVKVVLWDAASGKPLKVLRAPHCVLSLAFSPDSRMLAMTSGDREITLWNLAGSH